MDNDDLDYRNDPIFHDNWTDDGHNLDFNVFNFDLITVKDSVFETKLKKVATRINELAMHTYYQKYLDSCDLEDPPCEPIEAYININAWFQDSYVDASKAYCKEYDIPYNLFDDFKSLYKQIYDLNRSERINKSDIISKYSNPFHPNSN